MNEKSTVGVNTRNNSCDDEISLIDIYLMIKRNSKLFFSVILLSLLISIFIAYSKYQSSNHNEIVSNHSGFNSKYTLWIEIGRVYGANAGQSMLEQPQNLISKIKNIYIPKIAIDLMKSEGKELNQSLISVTWPEDTDLIVIKALKTPDNIDYNKLLTSLANIILENNNKMLSLLNKDFIIKPTITIQEPKEISVKNKNKKNNNIMILSLGVILGIFFGFFVVFIREFLKKVKEVEDLS